MSTNQPIKCYRCNTIVAILYTNKDKTKTLASTRQGTILKTKHYLHKKSDYDYYKDYQLIMHTRIRCNCGKNVNFKQAVKVYYEDNMD